MIPPNNTLRYSDPDESLNDFRFQRSKGITLKKVAKNLQNTKTCIGTKFEIILARGHEIPQETIATTSRKINFRFNLSSKVKI